MLKPYVGALSLLLLAAGKVAAGKLSLTDTITWGGDNSRSGYQSTHNIDPSVVGSSQFGQLWKAVLPGNYRGYTEQLYSQSLIYTLNDGIQYVFVSTTQNNVYKINAKTGAIVASRNLHVPFLTADLDACVDISPTVGVTATGVIDPDTDTWYLTAKTYLDQSDQTKGRLNGRYYFHAIDVNTLAEKSGFPRGLEGIIASNNANRMFQGGNAHQRPALLHTGQYIYAGFASHCVQYNFTGWIMGWDKTSGELVERFTTEGGPEANTVPGGGVWMSGGGIATDGKGSMYFSTGNGYSSQLSGTPVPGRQPPTALEEAAVNMKINDDGSLKVVDFFMPWEKVQLDGADKDLGTTPLELLQPDVFTCPNVKRMGVVTGKSGKLYILNLDNLGGYQQGPNKLDAVPQVIQNENSVYAGAGVYPLEGGYVYINVIQYPTHVFKFSCDASGNPSFTKVGDSPEKNAYILGVGHGTTTSLNGQAGTGLLWVSDVDGYNLRVYNAIPVDGQLQLIKTANVAGITKFTRPVFGDGRAYLGTVQGTLYCLGSPVNLPLTCTSPNDFGSVVINSTSTAKTIQCQANVDTQVTSITIKSSNFQISSLPTLPFSLINGQNISFQAAFAPAAPGPLSNDVLLATRNSVDGFSTSVPVSLKGIGDSLAPLLSVTPNLVSFAGVITGQEAGGRDQSIIFANQGDGVLTITGLDYSIASETGPLVTPNNTVNGPQVGPFTFKGLPTTIAGNSQAVVNINFNPTNSGNFAVYVHVRTDGGTKIFDVVGTAGTYPVAVLEFQAADGSGKWIPYTNNTPPFSFGNVFEQQTKIRKLRLTNNGSSSAASLSITVSKPPFGVSGIVGAQNGVDLAEGTVLRAGESATADLYCSVPKSQVNTDSYNGSTVWTMNTGDPNFGKQFIQFTCNAVGEQVGPLYPNGSAIYRYDGCWKENNPGRQLKIQLWGQDHNNTNGKCISACADLGYTYAGTQYVEECWCGNKIPSSQSNETDCNYACSGDETETCGGNGYFHDGSYISLFTNKPGVDDPKPPTPPAVVKSVGNYNYTACYTEGSGQRSLGAQNTASDEMTLEKCAAFCTGFTYFGIEYASECYCGNSIGVGSAPTAESDCSMVCSGNDTQICGGGNRLTLYTFNGKSPSSSLVSTSTSGSSASSISSASSSASPSATGPIAVPSAGAYAYQGCYTEGTNARALADTATVSELMTVEKCAIFCAGYAYMGVEYSSECYCANTIGNGAVLTSDGCSMTCGGNSTEFCGGGNRLNLYKAGLTLTSTSSTASVSSTATSAFSSTTAGTLTVSTTSTSASSGPSAVKTAGSFSYTGCYSEGTSSRALSDKSTIANGMTVEQCATFCSGYTYMGVEYSTECYCGNTIGAGAALAGDDCTMTCGGNPIEFCGGGNRLNLYKAGLTSTVTSSTASVSSTATSTFSSTTVGTSTVSTTLTSTSSGPSAVKRAGSFSYTGCYSEGTSNRALSDKSTVANGMTVEQCATFCSGYTYMGVEYSTECYCGNVIGAGAALARDDCTMTCGGNASEYCGGPNRLNFYKAGTSSSSSVISTTPTSSVTSSSIATTSTSSKLSSSTTTTPTGSSSSSSSVATTTSSKSSSVATTSTGSSSSSSLTATTASTSSVSIATTSTGSSSSSSSATNNVSSKSSSSVATTSTGSTASSKSSSSVTATSTGFSSSSSSVTNNVSSTSSSSVATTSTGSSSSSSSVTTTASSKSSSSVATTSTGSSSSSSVSATTASSKSSSGTTTSTGSISSSGFATTTPKSSLPTTTSSLSSQSSLTGPSSSTAVSASTTSVTLSSTNTGSTIPKSSSSTATTSITKSSSGSSTIAPSSTPTGPAVVQGNANFTYTACYVDSGARALSQLVLASDLLTVELCLQACSQYTYAGVEYGRECWCDTKLASSATQATAESQCNMKCAGNSSEICGAGNRLTLYTHVPKIKARAAFAYVRDGDSKLSLSSISQRSSVLPAPSTTSSGFITSSKHSTSGKSTSLLSTSKSQSSTKSSKHPSASPSTVTTSKSSSSLSKCVASKASISSSSKKISSSSFTTHQKPSSTSTTSRQQSITSAKSPSKSPSSSRFSSSSMSKKPSHSPTSSTSKPTSNRVTSTPASKSSSSKPSSTSIKLIPTPGQVVKDWVYLGCANQTSPPALTGMMKTSPGQMTLEICQDYCIHNYYGLAAVENGDTCSCGNGLQSYSILGHNSCNTPCAGNSSEICGGQDAHGSRYLSVWNSTSTAIIPTFVKQVGAYPRLGCYTNGSQEPAPTLLAAIYTNANGMTVESCVGYCITKNHRYAGLENGDTCLCGDTIATSSTIQDDVRCTMTCSGNAREFCGGQRGVLVYNWDQNSVVDGMPKTLNQDNTPLG